MTFDGEWRNAFIADDDSTQLRRPRRSPCADDTADPLRRAGRSAATVLGIPKSSPHPDAAWLLLKYLATDTQAAVESRTRDQ